MLVFLEIYNFSLKIYSFCLKLMRIRIKQLFFAKNYAFSLLKYDHLLKNKYFSHKVMVFRFKIHDFLIYILYFASKINKFHSALFFV